jgi:hypothetical protein
MKKLIIIFIIAILCIGGVAYKLLSKMITDEIPSDIVATKIPSETAAVEISSYMIDAKIPSAIVGAEIPSNMVAAEISSDTVDAEISSDTVDAETPPNMVGVDRSLSTGIAIKKPLSGTLTIYILAYNGRLPWKNRAFRDIVRIDSNGKRQDVYNSSPKAKSTTITHETLQNTHDSHIIRVHNVNEGDTISFSYRTNQPLFAASIEINNHVKSLMMNDWTLTGNIIFTNPKFNASKASIIKSKKIPDQDINELMLAGAPQLGDGLSIIPTCKDMGGSKYCQYRLNFKVSGLVPHP